MHGTFSKPAAGGDGSPSVLGKWRLHHVLNRATDHGFPNEEYSWSGSRRRHLQPSRSVRPPGTGIRSSFCVLGKFLFSCWIPWCREWTAVVLWGFPGRSLTKVLRPMDRLHITF